MFEASRESSSERLRVVDPAQGSSTALLLAAAAPTVRPAHADHTSSSRSRSAARSWQLPGGSSAPAQQAGAPPRGAIPSPTNRLLTGVYGSRKDLSVLIPVQAPDRIMLHRSGRRGPRGSGGFRWTLSSFHKPYMYCTINEPAQVKPSQAKPDAVPHPLH